MEYLHGNSWELLQEGSDLLFDENLAISVEDLYAFLDEEPSLLPSSDEQFKFKDDGIRREYTECGQLTATAAAVSTAHVARPRRARK